MTEPLSIKLGKHMKAELKALAEANRRTLSNYVAIVLEDHLKEQRRKAEPKVKK